MKRIMCVLLVVVVLLFIGCKEKQSTAEKKMRIQTEASLQEMNRQIGMPIIKNFQERKIAKMIFELRDQVDLITYTYIITITGKRFFWAKALGMDSLILFNIRIL